MLKFSLTAVLALLAVMFTVSPGEASAQAKIGKFVVTGTVVDTVNNKGAEYATVAVTDEKGAALAMAAAGADGKFTVEVKKEGTFTLTVSSMGISSASKPLTIDGTRQRIDLGQFSVAPQDVKLETVTVEAYKPLIKNDVDKLTYSVEADPESQSSTLVDMLRKVPQLNVDGDDNVTLNGQSNYKVLVNGKSSPMYEKNFKDVIRSMPASSIKDIEVITNPSSKYEAEGVGGIINIITVKKSPNGYNGSINLRGDTNGGYGGSVYAAAKIGKFNVSFNYNAMRPRQTGNTYENNSENFLSETYRYSRSFSNHGAFAGLFQAGTVDASYDIDSLNLLTLSFSAFSGRYKGDGLMTSETWDINHNTVRRFDNWLTMRNQFSSISGSFDYQKLFRKKDESLTISYKLDTGPEKTRQTNDVDGILDYESYRQRSRNKANGTEHTVQIDYTNPFGKLHTLEVGGKYILRQNTSDSEIEEYDPAAEAWIIQHERMNDLDYDQHIMALYAGYTLKYKKMGVKAGLRAERTWNLGDSKTRDGKTKFDNKLFNVIPYITLSYSLKGGQMLKLGYTQRLQRPSIWYLNPYVNDSDPMDISYGNPRLKSVISHRVSFDYSKNTQSWNLFLSLSGTFANNVIMRVTEVNQENVRATTYRNVGERQDVGLNASYSYRLGAKLNLNLSGNVNYVKVKDDSRHMSNDGVRWGGNANLNVKTWKGGSVRAGGGVFTSGVTLQEKGSRYYYNSVGLAQKFLKDKLTFSLNLNSPFEKDRENKRTTRDDTFVQRQISRYNARVVYFGLNYRFGKLNTQVKKARKTISNDDKLGGGNQGGMGGGVN